METSYIAIHEEDYAQSANSIFHFMKKEQYLKDILTKKAIVPRYCVENIRYLGIHNEGIDYEEVAVLQKCFCDIPFHKLMENFSLCGEGRGFDLLSEEDKTKASTNNTHPDFYGKYGIAFSKSWAENQGLQPIHYLNEKSYHTHDFTQMFEKVLKEEKIEDAFVDDILNRLSFIKPLRGMMTRAVWTKEKKEVFVNFGKNFHDEKEWRYVPSMDKLTLIGIERVIANPNIVKNENLIEEINKSIYTEQCKNLWLQYEYNDIRYIIVPDSQARINTINIIRTISESGFCKPEQADLEKQILISKILVLEEIRKDW